MSETKAMQRVACVAVRCIVLQCVVMCCGVLHLFAVFCSAAADSQAGNIRKLVELSYCVAVCCSVLLQCFVMR